jgi:hypothetical protein
VAAQLADSQEGLSSMESEKSEKIMAGNELRNSGETETIFLAPSCLTKCEEI